VKHDALGLMDPEAREELPILYRDARGQLIQYPFQHDASRGGKISSASSAVTQRYS
jgi:hypothetical protein